MKKATINNIVILFLISFFSMESIAQKMVIPGYQGKRLFAGINFEGFSTIDGYNSKGVTLDSNYGIEGLESSGLFAISGRLDAEGAYVLSRRLTGTLTVGTGKTGLVNRERFKATSSGSDYSGFGFYNFRYNYAAIGLQLQRKKKWGIAPIGPYWGVRYMIARSGQLELIKAKHSSEEGLVPVADCDCSLLETTEGFEANQNPEPQITHSLQLIFGSRLIIKDNFYYGLSMSVDPIRFSTLGDYIDSAQEKMNQLLLFNIRLSVGILF